MYPDIFNETASAVFSVLKIFPLWDVDLYLQMSWERTNPLNMWDFARYPTPTPLLIEFFSLFNCFPVFLAFEGISTSMTWTFLDLCFWHCLSIFGHPSNFLPKTIDTQNLWFFPNPSRMWWIWGPEGRLIRSTELAKGLLRFGGLYCFLEVWTIGRSLDGLKSPRILSQVIFLRSRGVF